MNGYCDVVVHVTGLVRGDIVEVVVTVSFMKLGSWHDEVKVMEALHVGSVAKEKFQEAFFILP